MQLVIFIWKEDGRAGEHCCVRHYQAGFYALSCLGFSVRQLEKHCYAGIAFECVGLHSQLFGSGRCGTASWSAHEDRSSLSAVDIDGVFIVSEKQLCNGGLHVVGSS